MTQTNKTMEQSNSYDRFRKIGITIGKYPTISTNYSSPFFLQVRNKFSTISKYRNENRTFQITLDR